MELDKMVRVAVDKKARANNNTGRFNNKEYVKALESEVVLLKKEKEVLESKLKQRDDAYRIIVLENNILDVSNETRIVSYVARYYNEDPKRIISRSHEGKLPLYRSIIYHLLYLTGKFTHKRIGEMFDVDRTTVTGSISALKDLRGTIYTKDLDKHITWVKENIK